MTLAASVLKGNRLALARLLTLVENNTDEGRSALNELFPHTGKAHLIGITGAPGTGKSSLVNQLALHLRNTPDTPDVNSNQPDEDPWVAIVAVDPSSPFTGGAILGDRVRMRDLSGDPGIFIRSMASRGSLGGLASTTSGLVQAMDAAGFNVIMIETVGAGQAEVDIARLAHTTLVVEAPGLGDDIQAIKAGILEIADVLVINKADRPGVDATERALNSMLQLAHPVPRIFQHHGSFEYVGQEADAELNELPWTPPIHKTVAIEGQGIEDLVQAIRAHYQYLHETGSWKERECARLQAELDGLLQETLVSRWRSRVPEPEYRRVLAEIVARDISPWQAVNILLDGGAA